MFISCYNNIMLLKNFFPNGGIVMKVDYNQLVAQQKIWKDTLPSDQYLEFNALSRELMHQAIDNNNELQEVDLRIPKGFSEAAIFYVVKAVFGGRKISKLESIGEFVLVSVTD